MLRVLDLLKTRPLSPEPPMLAKVRAALAKLIARLDATIVRQMQAAEEITSAAARGRELRRKLRRERMQPLVKLAKALRRHAPGVEAALKIPHKRKDSLTVAAAAENLVKALKPHAKLLVEAGYSRTYLSEVGSEARELAKLSGASDRARTQLSRETAAVARLIEEGQRQLEIADAIMTAHVKDAVVQGAWQMSRRVGERKGRPLERTRRKRLAASGNAASFPAPAA